MPFIKCNEEEGLQISQVVDSLANGGEVPGIVSKVLDSKHGVVFFLSEEPYMGALRTAGIGFEIIPKDQISTPYVEFLRQKYPGQPDL